jgi:hypothetical protein
LRCSSAQCSVRVTLRRGIRGITEEERPHARAPLGHHSFRVRAHRPPVHHHGVVECPGAGGDLYNIKFLSTEVVNQGDRLSKLREVMEALDAHVIGLQEIADRAALEHVFPPAEWHLVIDDDSTDAQDLAVAVRQPLRADRQRPGPAGTNGHHAGVFDAAQQFGR